MKKLMLPLIFAVASTTAVAKAPDIGFKTYKLAYKAPKKLDKLCKMLQEKDPSFKQITENGCLDVDIELLNTPHTWINQAVNGEFANSASVKEIKAEYDSTAHELYDKLSSNDRSDYHSQFKQDIELIGTSKRLTQIGSEWYEYHYGTPHGMPSKSFYVFDMQSKKQLTIDDIVINATKKAQLETLAFQQFKKVYQYKVEKDFNEIFDEQEFIQHQERWKLSLVDNFYFTPNGLTMSYNPYHLGPYAMGFFVLNLDKKDLEGVIKPEYLKETFLNFDDDDWSLMY